LQEILLEAVLSLPAVQARRTYEYYYLDMPLKSIAEIEGVSVADISQCILLGLKKLRKICISI